MVGRAAPTATGRGDARRCRPRRRVGSLRRYAPAGLDKDWRSLFGSVPEAPTRLPPPGEIDDGEVSSCPSKHERGPRQMIITGDPSQLKVPAQTDGAA